MNKSIYYKIFFVLFACAFLHCPMFVYATTVNVDAGSLVPKVRVYISPQVGSFENGSIFEVPVFVDTKNKSINGIEVRLNFDKDKLAIVNPTGGKSIIGLWVEPPAFNNTEGTISYVGVVPGGIVTQSGLIGVITFRAKATGDAFVSIVPTSKILLNDGLGTIAQADFGRGNYTIIPKTPEGLKIFSVTHPSEQDWYNNNSPVVSWVGGKGIEGFSFVLDNNPNTIPDNTVDLVSEDNTKSFENLKDGLWYFHIKALKNNIWGSAGHFLLKIDTTPPLKFEPKIDFLSSSAINSERALVSFSSSDNLSGIDHYEVGVIDKNQPATVSPFFIQTESPFQVPLNENTRMHVIVRAIDKAGNIREGHIDVRQLLGLNKFFKNYPIYILFGLLLLALSAFIIHFFVVHHLLFHIRRIIDFIKREEE